MIPAIHFILPLLSYIFHVVDNWDILDDFDDGILDITLLTNITNLIMIISMVVVHLDEIMEKEKKGNNIHDLIKFCNEYRFVKD